MVLVLGPKGVKFPMHSFSGLCWEVSCVLTLGGWGTPAGAQVETTEDLQACFFEDISTFEDVLLSRSLHVPRLPWAFLPPS